MPSLRRRLLRRIQRRTRGPAPHPARPAQPLPGPPPPWAPLRPGLQSLRDEDLAPTLRAALADGRPEALDDAVTELHSGLYALPMLSPEWCAALLEEVQGIEDWAALGGEVERPNSMNAYGVILDAFGLTPALDRLNREVVGPLAARLFPEVIGDGLDHHHGFVVTYARGKDVDLGFHVDDSEVTLNLCLGDRFEGGELYFHGRRCPDHRQTGCSVEDRYEHTHEPGVALLHAGAHRHGAYPLRAGERYNLILWCRSSSYRAAIDPGCPPWCEESMAR